MPDPWALAAISKIHADFNRSSDTHLLRLPMPAIPDINVYFKDESTHITGSLKHRLARSLFLYGLCNGWIHEGTSIVEASSGNTAVSEAYYANLLGLRFIAVMAKSTSITKIKRIEEFGGECVLVDDPAQDCQHARQLAKALNGHFMDQFTYAERATDWRGNNNIACSIFNQMREEPFPIPRWLVCGAGTGGTSATLGRYLHYRGYPTQLCVVDPSHSVFHHYFKEGDASLELSGGSGIEGIGRPRLSPSFLASVVDRVDEIPNAASLAAMHFLSERLGKPCGPSTGTNFYGVLQLIAEMHSVKEHGSIVTLICDHGGLYENTYFNADWLQEKGYDLQPYLKKIDTFYTTGKWA